MLQVNEAEAATVRHIFERYLSTASVHRLLEELERDGIRSKARVTSRGKVTGDQPFSRGAMFHLLQNRVYVGEIVHKDQCHPGQHEGIIDRDLFHRVQALLARQQRERRRRTSVRSPFVGKLFDSDGNRLTPTHSRGARGTSYRYYVPARLQQGQRITEKVQRYSAKRVDEVIGSAFRRISGFDDPADKLARAELSPHGIELTLPSRLMGKVRQALEDGEHVASEDDLVRWTIPASLQPRGGRAKVQPVRQDAPQRDPVLIKGLRAAHRLLDRDRAGLPVIEAIPQSRYAVRLMRLAFLSPSIQRDILAGRQPPRLRLEDLIRARIPLCWTAQERLIQRLSSAN